MNYKRIFIILFVFALAFTVYSCSNMHTSMGVSMNFGPNGPYVSPHVSMNMYGGGRW